MEQQPKVSVIIPVYNAEKNLKRCLDSLKAQTFHDFELICVDDGSEDESLTIAQSFAKQDERFRVISCEHTNAGNSRNIGLSQASGKYVCFLDSDDQCKENMLEKMVEAAQRKTADVVVCEAASINMSTKQLTPMGWSIRWNKIIHTKDNCLNAELYPALLFQLFIISPWTKLFLRELLVENQIQAQSQPAANDVVLVCSALASAKRIYPIKEVLYYQNRGNPSSITKTLHTDEKHLCGFSAALGLKKELIRLGKYQLLRPSYQQLAIHCCMFYLQKTLCSENLFEEDFRMLAERGLKELDLIDIDSRVPDNMIFASEYKSFLSLQSGSLSAYFQNEMQALVQEKDKLSSTIQKLKNSKSYRLGEFLLRHPKRIRNSLKASFSALKYIQFSFADTLSFLKRPKAGNRICIVALETFHYSITETIARICNPEKNDIQICTNKKAKNEIQKSLGDQAKKIKWCIMDDFHFQGNGAEQRKAFANMLSKKKNVQMFILPSPEYHPDWYKAFIERKRHTCQLIAGVHNLNSVFFSEIERSDVKTFFNQVDAYAVIDKSMSDLLKQNNSKKPIYVFPPIYVPHPQNKDLAIPNSSRIRLVITGLVEEKRKDYRVLVEALRYLEDIHEKLTLVLLGKANSEYADQILSDLLKMKSTGLEIISYRDYVSSEEFDRQMYLADCILAPIVSQTEVNGIKEWYGKTKISGVQLDIIKYSCPAIVVDDVPMPAELNDSVCYYHSPEDMAAFIRKLTCHEYRLALRMSTKHNSEKFLVEKMLW